MNVLYETACGHLASRSPERVDLTAKFECRSCLRITQITGVQLMEYRARCGGCHWTRYTGMSLAMANGSASRHAFKTGHNGVVSGWAVNPSAQKERERIQKGKLLLWLTCSIAETGLRTLRTTTTDRLKRKGRQFR